MSKLPTDPIPTAKAEGDLPARLEDVAPAAAAPAGTGPNPPSPAALVLGYAERGKGIKRLWRWVRPGTVLFFLIVAGITVGAGWGVWKWRVEEDRKAFGACAQVIGAGSGGSGVILNHAPSRAALRHLARIPGPIHVTINWPANEDVGAAEAFRGADLSNVTEIEMGEAVNADLLLKELARPDCGLKALTTLILYGTRVTDACIKDLQSARPGLKIVR